MQKKLFILVLCVLIKTLTAQNYPYLNASTGNKGQFVVDKDTNIFIFYGQVIEKLDKNYTSIWKKSYTDLYFYSLLLSKTGSLYFIAADNGTAYNNTNRVGKIEADGNLNWVKELGGNSFVTATSTISNTTGNFHQLFLDRNNNLIASGITGNSAGKNLILKLDTLGNVIKFKAVYDRFVADQNYNIINDSAGIYTLASMAHVFESSIVVIHKYNDALNTATISSGIASGNTHSVFEKCSFFKSKYNPNTIFGYYKFFPNWGCVGCPTTYISLFKLNDPYSNWRGRAFYDFRERSESRFAESLEEDGNKNCYFSMSEGPISEFGYKTYTKFTYVLDSNGVKPITQINFLNNYPTSPIATEKLKTNLTNTYADKFVYFANGADITNPIWKNMNLTFTTVCTSTQTPVDNFTITSHSGGAIPTSSTSFPLTVYDMYSYALTALAPSITNLTSFFDTDNCISAGISEIKDESEIIVYPNPTSTNLKIELQNNDDIKYVELLDITGKVLLNQSSYENIDVSNLAKGIYILKIKTSSKLIYKKIIKE